jgi:fluoride exporter
VIYFWIGVGGALGATARYATITNAAKLLRTDFPYGTFVVNVTGSFVAGFLALFLLRKLPEQENLRLLLTTGFLGGFTTFSAFSLEALQLVQRGETGLALAYVMGSVLLSLVAVYAGYALAQGFAA